jgi:hypothetical protein
MARDLRKLSMFSLIMSIDYVIGSIPLLPVMISWIFFPMAWILLGKKYALAYTAFSWAESLPQLLGYGGTAASGGIPTSKPAQPIQITIPYIPILTQAGQAIDHVFRAYVGPAIQAVIQAPIHWILDYAPLQLQPYLLLGYASSLIIGLMGFWYRVNIIETKYFLFRHLSFLESWGIFSDGDFRAFVKFRIREIIRSNKKLTKKARRSRFACFWILVERGQPVPDNPKVG